MKEQRSISGSLIERLARLENQLQVEIFPSLLCNFAAIDHPVGKVSFSFIKSICTLSLTSLFRDKMNVKQSVRQRSLLVEVQIVLLDYL